MSDIYIGKFVKAFGIKGELKLLPSVDFWEDSLKSKNLVLTIDEERRPVTIARSRPHGNTFIVRMDGIDDRNDAEALVGGEVVLPGEKVDVDFPNYPLPFQLVGLLVESEEGESLGHLSGVMHSAAHDVYEVTGTERTFLVPAVPEFVLSIDDERGVVVIRMMPGLLEAGGGS